MTDLVSLLAKQRRRPRIVSMPSIPVAPKCPHKHDATRAAEVLYSLKRRKVVVIDNG